MARDEAMKSRASSEMHRSSGDESRAEFENVTALKRQTEATSYTDKLQQKQKEQASMQQEAQLLQKQIADLQQRLATITGESGSHLL